jgi:hypothetical protein
MRALLGFVAPDDDRDLGSVGAVRTRTLDSLRPVQELARDKPHGNRIKYMGGCRCQECRRANTAYERERAARRRAGEWNGLVSADAARKHLAELRYQGVGRRAVNLATDVSDTVLQDIIAGRKQRIRARTARLILAVDANAAQDGAYICARRTGRLVHELLTEGFTKARISAEIGQDGRALQLGRKRVTVRSAGAIDRLWRRYMTPAGV